MTASSAAPEPDGSPPPPAVWARSDSVAVSDPVAAPRQRRGE